MWFYIVSFLLICIICNRLRGINRAYGLPGRSLFYSTFFIAGSSFMFIRELEISAAWAAAYLFWGVWPWGRWMDLEQLPDGYARPKGPSLYERMIEAVSAGSDHIAFFWRNMMILPGLVLVCYLLGKPMWMALMVAVSFSVSAVSAYGVGRGVTKYSTVIGELIVGLLWGYTIILFWSIST